MDVRTFLREADPETRETVAVAAGTSVSYLYLLAGGHRKPSPKLCRRLIAADPRFTLGDLRPDIYGAEALGQGAAA